MRAFARAGWPEHDRVTHVADVQIQTKRRVAFGDALHQGWSERRIHWTRRLFFPSPDRARWDQVREVKDRDIRPPDVLDAVARQTSNEGVHRIQGFDARRETRIINRLFDLLGGRLDFLPVLVKDDHGRGVIAAGGIPALDLYERFLRIFAHHLRVRVDVSIGVRKDLGKDAAHLLPPFFSVGFKEAGSLVPVQEQVAAFVQRYSSGSSASTVRIPGEDSWGNPSSV